MTLFAALVGIAALFLTALGPLLAIASLIRMGRIRREVEALQASLVAIETRLLALGRRVAADRMPGDRMPAATTTAAPVPVTEVGPPPVAAAPSGVSDADARPSPPPPPPSPPSPAAEPELAPVRPPEPVSAPPPLTPLPERADFVANLGPKILVATGALAFVVFLGLFVKYAWENEWVGPWGRVLSGATLSLFLVLAGTRLLGREYRPLGQGLCAMGFSGLYLACYGAHAFYDLVPRGLAGLLMVVVVVGAVVLAALRDTRLLALLAWTGGYLTPMLLSTGEDRAISLYLYLLLLALGAIGLDRMKPWPETTPLALAGTMLLYAGWYAQHYRAERFGVALLGLVLFTLLFGGALALRARVLLTGIVGLNAAFWLTLMAADRGRPEWVAAVGLALAFILARLSGRRSLGLGVVGLVAWALPYLAWVGAERPLHPEGFALAALWLFGGVMAFVLPGPDGARPSLPPALALACAGLGAIGLAADVDRPFGLLALLLSLAGLAVGLRPRVRWAELIGVVSAALAALAWFDGFYRADRGGEALALAVPVALVYVLALGGRVLLGALPLGVPGLASHLVAATLLFAALHRVFEENAPGVLASTLLALSAFYLVLGLASLRVRADDRLASGTALGLAIGFLTLAIPVWLGLHAITLAWAIEGTLLLGLGARHRSTGVRLAGYAVLGLSAIRLLACHLPLHHGTFVPVLNPSFGTWLFVVGSMGVGLRLSQPPGETGALDRGLRAVLATAALGLLFLATTAETQAIFLQWARVAEAAGRFESARFARRATGLGLSVLWTLFATGLLAGGLAARSRALYYSGFALFGLTALKVVFVDLATFPTVLRMFSFLALAVLLTAGAYLNLRFRARLAPGEAAR